LEQVSAAEPCFLKVVQEFVERFQKLKKTRPDKQVLERPVQEVIEGEISEELARGEEQGRKVPFVLG